MTCAVLFTQGRREKEAEKEMEETFLDNEIQFWVKKRSELYIREFARSDDV